MRLQVGKRLRVDGTLMGLDDKRKASWCDRQKGKQAALPAPRVSTQQRAHGCAAPPRPPAPMTQTLIPRWKRGHFSLLVDGGE